MKNQQNAYCFLIRIVTFTINYERLDAYLSVSSVINMDDYRIQQ